MLKRVPLKIVYCSSETDPIDALLRVSLAQPQRETKTTKLLYTQNSRRREGKEEQNRKKKRKNKNRHDARHTENIKSNQITKSRNLLNEWAEFAHYTTEKAILRSYVRSFVRSPLSAVARKINIFTCNDFLCNFFFLYFSSSPLSWTFVHCSSHECFVDHRHRRPPLSWSSIHTCDVHHVHCTCMLGEKFDPGPIQIKCLLVVGVFVVHFCFVCNVYVVMGCAGTQLSEGRLKLLAAACCCLLICCAVR